MASGGGPISEALLANGLPQKNNTEECFLQTIPGAMAIASQTNYRIKIFKKQRQSHFVKETRDPVFQL